MNNSYNAYRNLLSIMMHLLTSEVQMIIVALIIATPPHFDHR